MRWEKHKGLIFKMLHFCSLQLSIQSNSNLRIFFFKEQCVQFGVRWWFLLLWLQLLGDSLENVPLSVPSKASCLSASAPRTTMQVSAGWEQSTKPRLVDIPTQQEDTKRPSYLLSDLFLSVLCFFLPKLSTHRKRVVKHLGPVTHPALQSQGWSRWGSQKLQRTALVWIRFIGTESRPEGALMKLRRQLLHSLPLVPWVPWVHTLASPPLS